MEDVYNLLYITGFVIVTTPFASVIIITFIVAVSVASLAYCITVGEGRPEVDCVARNIVIVGQKLLLHMQHNYAILHLLISVGNYTVPASIKFMRCVRCNHRAHYIYGNQSMKITFCD